MKAASRSQTIRECRLLSMAVFLWLCSKSLLCSSTALSSWLSWELLIPVYNGLMTILFEFREKTCRRGLV